MSFDEDLMMSLRKLKEERTQVRLNNNNNIQPCLILNDLNNNSNPISNTQAGSR